MPAFRGTGRRLFSLLVCFVERYQVHPFGFLTFPNFPVLVHKRGPIYWVRLGVMAHAYSPSTQEAEDRAV